MAASDIFANCTSKYDVFIKLKTTICCDFLDEVSCRSRFNKFKLNCRLYFKTPREQDLSTAHEICDCLESKGELGVDNYDTLKKLTLDVDNRIIELILAAEEKVNFLEKTVEFKVDKLRKTLLKINNNTAGKTKISPLQKRGKDICVHLLYAPVVIREDPGHEASETCNSVRDSKTQILRDPKEILYKNDEPVRYVFMHGEAARGKTTYCKQLLKYWCTAQIKLNKDELSEEEKALWEIDFTFFVSLRQVHQSRTSLEDMICFDLFRHNNECHDAIRHVLSSERYKCLILVDGLDEWRISRDKLLELTHDGLPNVETFSNCTCLFTFRPWKLEVLASSISGLDRVVQITGLNEKGQNLVIDNVLRNYYELKENSLELGQAKGIINQKIRKLKMKSLLEIPLLATASIMLWHEQKEIGDNITSLYLAIVQLLIRRAFEQQNFSGINYETLKSKGQLLKIPNILRTARFKTLADLSGFLFSLGKLAYHDLMSDETHLVFDKTRLVDEFGRDELDFALKVGLLNQYEAPGCFDEENVSIIFFHKSVQEFLASFYVATTKDCQLMFAKLTSIKSIMELSNVFEFLSGLSSHLASKMSHHIVEIANGDNGIRLARETFLDKYIDKLQSLYLFQVRCYQEMKYGERASHSVEHELITFHVGDICPPYDCDNEIIQETVEIISNHYSSTVSLYLWFEPSVWKCRITDKLLSEFLTNARCLRYLFIRGDRDRTIGHINETMRLKSLHLVSVKLPQAAIRGIQKSIESHRELRALTLMSIECIDRKGKNLQRGLMARPTARHGGHGHGQGHEKDGIRNGTLLTVSDILNVLPGCTNLYMLVINYLTLFSGNTLDNKTFLTVLPQLYNLRWINYPRGGLLFNEAPDLYDSSVLEILLKMRKLQFAFLKNININYKTGKAIILLPLRDCEKTFSKWATGILKSHDNLKRSFRPISRDTHIDDGTYEVIPPLPTVTADFSMGVFQYQEE